MTPFPKKFFITRSSEGSDYYEIFESVDEIEDGAIVGVYELTSMRKVVTTSVLVEPTEEDLNASESDDDE